MIDDDFDLPRARAFGRPRNWVVCPRAFSWRILAAGGRIDVQDYEPELPPHCRRPVFFRSRNGVVRAILAQDVSAGRLPACQQFAQANGLAIDHPADWPGAVLWLRSPDAIEEEKIERQKEWARHVERDWRIMGREALRRATRSAE